MMSTARTIRRTSVLRPLEEKRPGPLERRTDEPSTATRAARSRDATGLGYRGARLNCGLTLSGRIEGGVEGVPDEIDADEDQDEHEPGEEPRPPAEAGHRRVVREPELELHDIGDEVTE